MVQVFIHLIQLLKKDFIALKVKFDKLDIDKLINVSSGLSNLKFKVDDLDDSDVYMSKTVAVDLKKNK